MTPRDPTILKLWAARQALYDEARKYSDAITALQRLCPHKNEVDTSRHGSPDYECPDCGNSR